MGFTHYTNSQTIYPIFCFLTLRCNVSTKSVDTINDCLLRINKKNKTTIINIICVSYPHYIESFTFFITISGKSSDCAFVSYKYKYA